jgi:hypothetical protein
MDRCKILEWLTVFVSVILLSNCASQKSTDHISLKQGTPWQEAAKVGGKPTVKFSYVMDGNKYDLVSMENSTSPVVFKNSRLFKVLPANATTEFDRKIAEHLKTVDLPFEHGVKSFHSWILATKPASQKPEPHDPTTAGDIAEAATAGVILLPIAPILLAGGVCSTAEYTMTGSERTKAQQVNESLLASGPSYGNFLNQFNKHDFHTKNGDYQIREYLATDGAFFTGRDFFYEVGFLNNKPLWVTYKNDAVRFHVVAYWSKHR